MNIGSETKRAKLRLTVHRGGVGQRPNRLSTTHPVATGETILSGMVCTLKENPTKSRLEWIKGVTVDSQPNQYFFAYDDSTDGDVQAAGNLQGLSVHGDYELSTAHFAEGMGISYSQGTPLTADAATGNVKPAQAGDVVIGIVSRDYAPPVDLAAGYVEGSLLPADDANITAGVQGGVFITGKATNAVDLRRIRFTTVQPYALPALDGSGA